LLLDGRLLVRSDRYEMRDLRIAAANEVAFPEPHVDHSRSIRRFAYCLVLSDSLRLSEIRKAQNILAQTSVDPAYLLGCYGLH
jgi:hypothetical protein